MSKILWAAGAAALLAILVGWYFQQQSSAAKWEKELLRRNVEVGGPGGPLPLALWPGTPRKVAFEAAQSASKGRLSAASSSLENQLEAPGLRIAEEPCTMQLIFHADRLLGVVVAFESRSPVVANRLKLGLLAKYGKPEKVGDDRTLSWKIATPPPYSVTAGLIENQLVMLYLDNDEVWRAANGSAELDDLKKLVGKMGAIK